MRSLHSLARAAARLTAVAAALASSPGAADAPSAPPAVLAEGKELLAQLVAIDTSPAQSTAPAVALLAARLRAAGFRDDELFVGGSRAHHYQDLFNELGMTTVAAGYEFAHRDDYEGRHVLPTIKQDADSKNIEELKVSPDPELYNPRKSKEELEALKAKGLEINGYEGMMKQMAKKSLVIDDVSHYESEKLIEMYKPDIFCAGIKEKYVVQKMGVPLKQLHSYDYGGPYTGFVGAVNFYKDIDRMVNNPVWKLIQAPWEKPEPVATNDCELEATYVTM
jgi:nitrogenase molybdenum-iron protein alpha chain